MSNQARRLSKSKDDKKMIQLPKKRDRSKAPQIYIRMPGRGRAIVKKDVIVGDILWGIIEKYSCGDSPIFYCGNDWELSPYVILSINNTDVIVLVSSFKNNERALVLKVPRVDHFAYDREESDSYFAAARRYSA